MTTRAVARLRQVISLPGSNASPSLTNVHLHTLQHCCCNGRHHSFLRETLLRRRESRMNSRSTHYDPIEEGTGSLTLSSLMRCWGTYPQWWVCLQACPHASADALSTTHVVVHQTRLMSNFRDILLIYISIISF